uniref:AAA-like domain-containing protein n=1 Tax=Candidatus Kentrum sp. TUN TaxID=2126343 RepID=A0A450ZJ03_9GAMM|nr:MAG: AAA-like domain-containing protein [Candidatus Kentron sp. TUN]VFK67814.1 MAG: AAA-like domain-containing protein [Candidatus Kentron sp. TUN]
MPPQPTDKPVPQYDPRTLTTPGGAVSIDARFYIERPVDALVLERVRTDRALLTLRGARQSGKTSLMLRIHAAGASGQLPLRSAFVDVQAMPLESLQSLEAAWIHLAEEIADQLGLPPFQWAGKGNHERGFKRFLQDSVFAEDDTPLLICLDEADRLFSTPLRQEFFASLRACWNRGAIDPVWKKVRWLLGTSSDPVFFIEDLTQSPFNVGTKVKLDNFHTAQVSEFARRLGLSEPVHDIMTYVGGRPYLVHLLLYHLARNPENRADLFDGVSAGHGVFRDHLHRYLIQFQQDAPLTAAMGDLLAGRQVTIIKFADRLEAAGLATCDENNRYHPACRLYEEFFGNALARNKP